MNEATGMPIAAKPATPPNKFGMLLFLSSPAFLKFWRLWLNTAPPTAADVNKRGTPADVNMFASVCSTPLTAGNSV
jgi:hypothetical protein